MDKAWYLWLCIGALLGLPSAASATGSSWRCLDASVLNAPQSKVQVIHQFYQAEGQEIRWSVLQATADALVQFQVAQVAGKTLLQLPELAFTLKVAVAAQPVVLKHRLKLPGDGSRPLVHLLRWEGGAVLLKTYPQGILEPLKKVSLLAAASAHRAAVKVAFGEHRVAELAAGYAEWEGVAITDSAASLPSSLTLGQVLVVIDPALAGHSSPVVSALGKGRLVRVPSVWLVALPTDPGVQLQLILALLPTHSPL